MRIESIAIPMIRQVVKRPRLADYLFRFDRWGNPFSLEAVANPQISLDLMRQDDPVVWRAPYQQWFVHGYDEAREVLASPHVGTANQMDTLLDVRPYNQLNERSQSFFRNLMLLTDPPQHTRLRKLVNRAFTPRQVTRLEPRLEEMADRLIAGFGDEVELMGDFATEFPAAVISELLGFGHGEWRWLDAAGQVLVQALDPFRGFDPAEMGTAVATFGDRILAAAEERRLDPGEDVLTGLALAEADGDRLSEDELVSVAGLILVAGFETTAMMFGYALMALHDHPDQLELIRERPDLWPNAVEEILRYETSVRSDPRTALEDFELAGKQIKAGQNILVMNHAANRDRRRFADADELRLDRENPSPISFGHGIHYCLGANLARAELRIGLPRLIEALGDYRIDRDRIVWRESITLPGPARLPIRTGERAAATPRVPVRSRAGSSPSK
ncbi:MAG: cytochrome P450 [Actinomycetota bacterium]